jgi:hypothetical protein
MGVPANLDATNTLRAKAYVSTFGAGRVRPTRRHMITSDIAPPSTASPKPVTAIASDESCNRASRSNCKASANGIARTNRLAIDVRTLRNVSPTASQADRLDTVGHERVDDHRNRDSYRCRLVSSHSQRRQGFSRASQRAVAWHREPGPGLENADQVGNSGGNRPGTSQPASFQQRARKQGRETKHGKSEAEVKHATRHARMINAQWPMINGQLARACDGTREC